MAVRYDGKFGLVDDDVEMRIQPCCRGMDLAVIDGYVRTDYDTESGREIVLMDVFTRMNISREVRIRRCPWCGARILED